MFFISKQGKDIQDLAKFVCLKHICILSYNFFRFVQRLYGAKNNELLKNFMKLPGDAVYLL